MDDNTRAQEIRQFILRKVLSYRGDVAPITAEHFGISRLSVAGYLRGLVRRGLLETRGTPKRRRYSLRRPENYRAQFDITPQFDAGTIWQREIRPWVSDVPSNVLDICEYSITAMLKNAAEYSGSDIVVIDVQKFLYWIHIDIVDYGVGIFNRIQRDLKLNDPREAALNLLKGKLPLGKKHRAGEGIFITSHLLHSFFAASEGLMFTIDNTATRRTEGIIPRDENDSEDFVPGTHICMRIDFESPQTVRQVFEQYRVEPNDLGFSQAEIPVRLIRHDDEKLVTRSQAKRLLAYLKKFNEIRLDFTDVATIGQPFADEIFRVYRTANPNVVVYPRNMNPDVERMVLHVAPDMFEQ